MMYAGSKNKLVQTAELTKVKLKQILDVFVVKLLYPPLPLESVKF